MSAIIGTIIGELWPYLLAAGAGAVALWRVYAAGQAKQVAKQNAERLKTLEIADQVDNDIGAMTTEQRRAELKQKWQRK